MAQDGFCSLQENCKIWFDEGCGFGYGANHKWENYPHIYSIFTWEIIDEDN